MNIFLRSMMLARRSFSFLMLCLKLNGLIEAALTPYLDIPPGSPDESFRCEPQEKPNDKYFQKINDWRLWHFVFRKPEYVQQRTPYQDGDHAGIWEFPYLIDVRTLDSENYKSTKDWFNANLVTSRYALTTCDSVGTFEIAKEPELFYSGSHGSESYTWKHNNVRFKNFVLVKKDPRKYKILYASAYNYMPTKGREDEIGTRLIKAFLPHPGCSYFNADMSFGIIVIKDPIYPLPPYTSYLHLDFNCTAYQGMKLNYEGQPDSIHVTGLEYFNYRDASCMVGMWGRYIAADGVPLPFDELKTVVNYKVRYRLRPVDPYECTEVMHMYPQRFRTQPKDVMECMGLSIYDDLGVICDHDRGAPIVCGQSEGPAAVRAFVLAGVIEPFCKTDQPRPFMVIDARMMFPMYAQINSLVLNNVTRSVPEAKGEGLRLYIQQNNYPYFFTFSLHVLYSISNC